MRTVTLASKAAQCALEKGAQSVQVLDLRGKVDYTDLLVLCSGSSSRHVSAIAESVEDTLRKAKVRPTNVEGMAGGSWVLIDYTDVVVHVFLEDVRAYYDIEGLWMDAPRLPVKSETDEPEKPETPAPRTRTRSRTARPTAPRRRKPPTPAD